MSEKTGFAMANDFANRPDIHCDEGHPRNGGLDENDRDRFVVAGKHQSVKSREHL